MKTNFLRTLVIAFAALGVFSLQSCDPDPCKDVTCGNGVCLEGTCLCEDGYDGTDCNILIRSVFTGTYIVAEDCDTDPGYIDSYVSRISESAQGVNAILIDNIYNFGSFADVDPEDATIKATVSATGGDYVLLIDNQGFASGVLPNYEIAGSGTYNSATSEITVTYSITDLDLMPTDSFYIDNCTQIYTPQ